MPVVSLSIQCRTRTPKFQYVSFTIWLSEKFWSFNFYICRLLKVFIQVHFNLLCFTLLHSAYMVFFANWGPVTDLWGKSLWHHFSSSIAHSSLCVTFYWFFQNIKISHYYYVCYSDLWSAVFDVTIVILFGHQGINKSVCAACSMNWPFPHLSPSCQASLFSEIQQYSN